MKYLHQDILVPGPFTISASLANTSRELCDGVHQQWEFSLNINKVNLGDQISSVSFVHGVVSVSERLEEVTVTTLGLKNMHRDILMTLYVRMCCGQLAEPLLCRHGTNWKWCVTVRGAVG